MMRSREELLKSIDRQEDRIVLAHLLDRAEFAARVRKPSHTEFLDPHQLMLAERVLAFYGGDYEFFGGFPGAERAIALFYPDYTEEDERDEYRESVFKVLEVRPNARGSLSHRDYLGALMGLGIKREITGDILVEEEKCSIVVLEEIADYIASNLLKVGNTGVNTTIVDIMNLSAPEPKEREIRTTVAALRLDSVCAPAFGISRSKSAEWIKAGKVNLNWEASQNPDKAVREGDTISIRGKGRAVLEKVGGRTRKDRLAIIIRKLV
jgi:RNA-binding protein YlmH